MMVAALLLPQLACATLGEPEASIAADGQQLRASVKSLQRSAYGVHEIALPSGTLLREYATVGGRVFAVTWSGPAMPNLRQSLGTYFDAYVSAAKSNHADHRRLQVQRDDLVIQATGHMRAFSGRAYLPQALPSGIAVDELN